jgi:hypothetical protein
MIIRTGRIIDIVQKPGQSRLITQWQADGEMKLRGGIQPAERAQMLYSLWHMA